MEKITSYRPEKEGSDDLKHIALSKMIEHYWKEVKAFKTPLEGAEKKIASSLLLEGQVEYIAQVLMALLKGHTIRRKVCQSMRIHWKKWKAQNRRGEEVDLQEGERILRREGRINDTFEKPEEEADISARMWAVLKEAQKHKRWGDKAIKAFKYYCEGKTEKKASEMAGITERTFRNNISRLNKIFTSSK